MGGTDELTHADLLLLADPAGAEITVGGNNVLTYIYGISPEILVILRIYHSVAHLEYKAAE